MKLRLASKVEETEPLDIVKDRFKQLQVRTFPRPIDNKGALVNPALPYDLTLLDDTELGRLFSEFCAMAQYVKLHLAVRAVEVATKKRQEKITRAKIRMEKTGTVQDKEAKVEVDPRTREASFETLVTEGTEVMTHALMESYLIGRDACSRELSRRQRVYEAATNR